MSKFSDRLKEERMRLCLSQSAFAQKIGIHRNTQIKYESGERHPDSEYFDLIDKIGVDVLYLWSGVRSEEKEMYDLAAFELCEGVYRALGFNHDEIKEIILKLARIADLEYSAGGACDTDEWKSKLDVFVKNILSGIAVDVVLLGSIIEGVEMADVKSNSQLMPAKKAQAVVMLYRAFKASGKVDQKMIEEAVKLAAG